MCWSFKSEHNIFGTETSMECSENWKLSWKVSKHVIRQNIYNIPFFFLKVSLRLVLFPVKQKLILIISLFLSYEKREKLFGHGTISTVVDK